MLAESQVPRALENAAALRYSSRLSMRATPDLASFSRLYAPLAVVPVRVEIEADTETPVSAFLKLSRGQRNAFLFESVEGGERWGRWSFLGAGPRRVLRWKLADGGDPLVEVARALSAHRGVDVPGAPPFCGGLVGHLSYDVVKLFEPRVPIALPDELGFPDVLLMDFDTVVAFDGVRHTLQIISEARHQPGVSAAAAHQAALGRIERTLWALRSPLTDLRGPPAETPARLLPRTRREDFLAAVARARDYVRAGDCQQIVVSQRFDAEVSVRPFEIYRALRRVNPSPYLFYLQDGEQALVGSSPETLVRLGGGEVTVRPIAGTRKRGRDEAEDRTLEAELRADPKENAEHVMLVDLGRNDVGRVAEIGTVRVDEFASVERYSHVMHLVSQVRGRLARGRDALDVLRAAFPAGTVTGAPKVRAMEIIDTLEPARRGPYAGCAGYFDRRGGMEMAIAIRTLLQNGRRVSVQAGAGVVFDSRPVAEYEETVNKAKAIFAAVAQAESHSLDAPALALAPPTAPARERRGKAVRA
jgi:anthranilate synthase component 1